MNTFTGNTVEAAIQSALDTLAIDRNQVTVKVIQKGKKGFFGLGKQEAIVEVTKIEPEQSQPATAAPQSNDHLATTSQIERQTSHPSSANQSNSNAELAGGIANSSAATTSREETAAAIQQLKEYLDSIIAKLGVNAESTVTFKNSKNVIINFDTKEEGLLIGKHGLTINALQTLAEIYLNRLGIYHVFVELDTANYRQRRLDVLEKLAEKTARDVVSDGKPVYLDPMPSFERKKIHKTLENHPYVRTYSAGREPYRAVVVVPK